MDRVYLILSQFLGNVNFLEFCVPSRFARFEGAEFCGERQSVYRAVVNMSAPKPDKGGKKDDEKIIIIKVAGVVVATGIAWGLYKTFSKSDHPLKNTEIGVKKDAANAKVNC